MFDRRAVCLNRARTVPRGGRSVRILLYSTKILDGLFAALYMVDLVKIEFDVTQIHVLGVKPNLFGQNVRSLRKLLCILFAGNIVCCRFTESLITTVDLQSGVQKQCIDHTGNRSHDLVESRDADTGNRLIQGIR